MEMCPFDPDPEFPTDCQTCGLPKANRRHDAPAAAKPLRSATRNSVHLSPHATQESFEAGLRAFPRSGTIKAELLNTITTADIERGMTDKELEQALPRIGVNSLRPRRVDLVHDGWLEPVRDNNNREVTRGGFTAWRLSAAGRHQWSKEVA